METGPLQRDYIRFPDSNSGLIQNRSMTSEAVA